VSGDISQAFPEHKKKFSQKSQGKSLCTQPSSELDQPVLGLGDPIILIPKEKNVKEAITQKKTTIITRN
jgi:hypothetical protein